MAHRVAPWLIGAVNEHGHGSVARPPIPVRTDESDSLHVLLLHGIIPFVFSFALLRDRNFLGCLHACFWVEFPRLLPRCPLLKPRVPNRTYLS